MAEQREAPQPQSFTEYVLEAGERLLDGLMTEREFATAIARAAAGEQPFTDAATDCTVDPDTGELEPGEAVTS
jgi:hypothetical protein